MSVYRGIINVKARCKRERALILWHTAPEMELVETRIAFRRVCVPAESIAIQEQSDLGRALPLMANRADLNLAGGVWSQFGHVLLVAPRARSGGIEANADGMPEGARPGCCGEQGSFVTMGGKAKHRSLVILRVNLKNDLFYYDIDHDALALTD